MTGVFLRFCGQHIWPEMFASNSLQGADSSNGVWAYVKTLLGLVFSKPKRGTSNPRRRTNVLRCFWKGFSLSAFRSK